MERIRVVTGGVVGIERERAVIRRLGVCPAPFLKRRAFGVLVLTQCGATLGCGASIQGMPLCG